MIGNPNGIVNPNMYKDCGNHQFTIVESKNGKVKLKCIRCSETKTIFAKDLDKHEIVVDAGFF